MYPKQYEIIEEGAKPTVGRYVGGREMSEYGAFPRGERVDFRVTVPRRMGCEAVVMRFAKDGEAPTDIPLDFDGIDGDRDVYVYTLDTAEVAPTTGGLFRYEFLFLRGERTLFTDSRDNVDFDLSETNANRFRLLVYRADFAPPAWFREGTMYHIFLDRFKRGAETQPHGDGVLDPDWENGTPQYAERAGGELANNVFFGGNLQGVCEKLDFLQGLGVTVLYLSPVFEAASNHRYDTGDYEVVDSLLGGEAAFRELIDRAHARGMRVILDGVFNHTGDDSRYFNRRGHYPTVGAYRSEASPWAKWYRFRTFPDDYECWWGIRILPRLNHDDPDCRRYFTGRDGIGARWIRAGADGWRLDVADELSDRFLDELRASVKSAGAESGRDPLILGEVWENAADKVSYGAMRRYLWGGQLDSVMNYPFRNAALALLRDSDSDFFRRTLTELYASYPRAVSDSLMNLLGTHDTARILTVLGDPSEGGDLPNSALAVRRLSPARRATAKRLLMLGSVLQFTVFGVPSVYYGDEAGMEGYGDPFCRMPYPWGREDRTLLAHYRCLGRLRRARASLHGGDFRFLPSPSGTVLYERVTRKPVPDRLLVAVNPTAKPVTVPLPRGSRRVVLSVGRPVLQTNKTLRLPPRSCAVMG